VTTLGGRKGALVRSGSLLAGASVGFCLLALPVMIRGAPLADDFNNCIVPIRDGLGPMLAASWERLGVIRPARFVEIFVTTGVCQHLPFGVAIAVPLVLTLAVAWLLRALLKDLGVSHPWPDLGGVAWLLQPLGTEAALWPAALHVPLGLACALGCLLAQRRSHYLLGGAAALGAFASAEQSIIALPLAVWLITPGDRRRRATVSTGLLALAVIGAYLLMPAGDPRLQIGLWQRVTAVAGDPVFYLQFWAVGLGLHSIPLAVAWGFPLSVGLLAAGVGAGWFLGPRHVAQPTRPTRGSMLLALASILAIIALMVLPLVATVPRQGSPRTFAPVWLVLAAAFALWGRYIRWRPAVRVAAGVFAAGAVASLVFSVSVRLASADLMENAALALAPRVPEGGVIAVCDVPRTVVDPAPRGAFAVHDLIYDWGARAALFYYTSRDATFVLHGPLWPDAECPSADAVDVHADFDDLRSIGRPS
jgi:hypothetical protein